jgi:acyl carrier protein
MKIPCSAASKTVRQVSSFRQRPGAANPTRRTVPSRKPALRVCNGQPIGCGEKMDVRNTVVTQFREVAHQQDRPLVELHDGLPLADTGLDSLCLAIIVARLEDALGVDPFATSDEIPTTFGDFVALYEHARA